MVPQVILAPLDKRKNAVRRRQYQYFVCSQFAKNTCRTTQQIAVPHGIRWFSSKRQPPSGQPINYCMSEGISYFVCIWVLDGVDTKIMSWVVALCQQCWLLLGKCGDEVWSRVCGKYMEIFCLFKTSGNYMYNVAFGLIFYQQHVYIYYIHIYTIIIYIYGCWTILFASWPSIELCPILCVN